MQPSARELAEFNGLLASVVDRGLPLAPAVEMMVGVVRDGILKEALRGVSRALGEGAPLHDALARFPEAFPAEYCALIRAGLEGGRLADVLRTAQSHQTLRARLRSKLNRFLLYVLIGAALGEAVLALAVIGVQFCEQYNQEIGQQLEMRYRSLPSEWLSDAARSGWSLLLLVPVAFLILATLYVIVQRWARLGWVGYLIPFWGPVQKSRDLALFCCTLGLKLQSGAAMVPALQSARETIANRRFRGLVDRLLRRVEEGESLSAALFYASFFPRTLAWGLSLGEENGEVPRSLETFTRLYTVEMERRFEVIYEVLTPLGILAVGNLALLSALIATAPFLDIISIQQNLSFR